MVNSDQIGGIIRALVSAIGGYFIGKGVIDANTVAQISGAAATIGVAVWSIFAHQTPTTQTTTTSTSTTTTPPVPPAA
jgi:hypothetical protein